MRGLVFVLCMTISLNSFASGSPDSSAKGGPVARLDMEPGFFETPYVVVKGKRYDLGFAQRVDEQVLEVMSDNPKAVAFLEEHRSAGLRGTIGLFGGLGVAIGYLVVKRNDFQPGIYWGLFLVGAFYGVYNFQKSQAYLMKAVNAYNGVEYAPQAGFKLERTQPLDPKAVHVSLLSLSF